MKCERCLNTDVRMMFRHDGITICRMCISFQSGLNEVVHPTNNENVDPEYSLQFSLSNEQKELSKQLIDHVFNDKDVLVYAACGSGKTEIVLDLIKFAFKNKKIIGIAVPRRQVVLQLQKRLAQYFEGLSVVAVCEGYTDVIYGDLIVCTTHQLFRYEKYFDILIVDEPDAFPFADNLLLQNIMGLSVNENIVYLSATPTDEMKEMTTLKLFRRFHGHDLLVPTVVVAPKIVLLVQLMKYLKRVEYVMLFVPTIKLAQLFSKLMNVPCIHSETKDKEFIIERFEKREVRMLICTTIMERGVTFEAVNICVLFSDHPVFTKASLIQIAGRVGRSASHPYGEGLFLCSKKSEKVDECLKELRLMNA